MPTRKNPALGKWRITEMELWDAEFVDMLELAYITFEAKGGGEFVFGAVRGDLDCRYGPDGVRFTWEGYDEMDPAFGAGSAKLAGRVTHWRDPFSPRRRVHLQGAPMVSFSAPC
jgi:hypothetical protein